MKDITNGEASSFEEKIATLYDRLGIARENKDLGAIRAVIADINDMMLEIED